MSPPSRKKMLEARVRVINHLGLHARAAGQLVKLAGRFKSTVVVLREDGKAEANARSMLSLLGLGASMNTVLILQAEGPDREDAVAAIIKLFESGFGES